MLPDEQTSPEQHAVFRQMTPERRLSLAEQLYWSARNLKSAGLRAQHGDWTEEQQMFLHDLIEPDKRALFLSNEDAAFEQAGLTEEERSLVRDRNWIGLIHYGVIFFMLEKLGAVVGVPNPHIYAAMRGQTIEDFQKSRNAQIVYSVAGEEGSEKLEK